MREWVNQIGYITKFTWPLPNVWLGVTIEKPEHSYRATILAQTAAAVRFVSFEPLLGSFADCPGVLDDIDWAIVGGESGPGARPMHPDWARSLRDQCQAAGVPFLFKQWGEWYPNDARCPGFAEMYETGGDAPHKFAGDMAFARVGKKRAGRLLDGREWNEYPLDRGRADVV
jgi:protein gp37